MTAQEKREYAIKLNADSRIIESRVRAFMDAAPYETSSHLEQTYRILYKWHDVLTAMQNLEAFVRHSAKDDPKGSE